MARDLAFAPESVAGALILALAALIALALHQIAVRLIRRLLIRERHDYLRSLLLATTGPTRLAFLVLAVFAAMPAAAFDPDTSGILAHILSVATVALAGWIAITAVHLAGDLYLLRFRANGLDNFLARKQVTQVRILRHVGYADRGSYLGIALMRFDSVRQFDVSLFASAGVAGLVAGLAARPMLSNLIAGIQIATTQPIRLGDEVMVENQWGRVEEITSTYVVLGLWHLRRLMVPLTCFIESRSRTGRAIRAR